MTDAPRGTVRVQVNGDSTELERGCTVARLVDTLIGSGGARKGLAVAVNRELVPWSDWGSRRLSEGDQVEVLSPAQGG